VPLLGFRGARALLLSTSLLVSCSDASDHSKRRSQQPVGDEPDAGDASGDGDQDPGDDPAGDGDAPQGPPKTCADVETTPVRTVPSVVFLVDGSSSMECVYPEDLECDCFEQVRGDCKGKGSKTRWQALSESLLGVAGAPGLFAELGSAIRFGLWIYNDDPFSAGTSCPGFPTQVNPALDQSVALDAAFPAEPPGQNTPTGPALAELVASLPASAEREQQKLGPQRVVLATDGQPFACLERDPEDPYNVGALKQDPASVLSATDAARAKDIDLYVLSLAPTAGEFASHLAEVASRGNTSHAYAPADKGQLTTALREIIESAISCTVELSGYIEDPSHCTGQATLGEAVLTCGDANGFTIVDANHVRLEGTACQRFKREPGIELAMTFPCEAFELR
jgi:hypothetical protein